MFLDLLFQLWRRLRGDIQWWLLWLVNSKFMVSVAGVVIDEAGWVLLQRHRYWVPEVWGLPGGIVQRGERLETAFAREVAEETGLEVTDVRLVRLVSGYNLRLEAIFQAYVTGTSPSLRLQKQEVLAARFFSPDELPANMLELQKEAIDAVLRSRG
jgi:8-oxo-dGTP diphosphatase